LSDHNGARALLRTFGVPRLTLADESGGGYGAGKTLALLVYLATRPRGRATRDQLADLLWSREEQHRGRQSLRQAVFTVRKLLGADALLADDDGVMLAPGVLTTDRDQFLAAVEAGDADEALKHYTHPFLAGFVLSGAEVFDEWALAERAALRRALLRLCTDSVTVALRRGDAALAVRVGQSALAVEPDDEVLVVAVSDALLMQGEPRAAQLLLESCIARREAASEPVDERLRRALARSRELRAETARVDAAGDATNLSGVGASFVGRDDAMQGLFAAAEQARRREVVRRHLVGPPGIGKSRLLGEFAVRLRQRGVMVFGVRCGRGSSRIAWSGYATMVRELAAAPAAAGIDGRHAATLIAAVPETREQFPGAPPPDLYPAADLLRVRAEALGDLLTAVAESRLVVVLVDDWHECDADTREALRASPIKAGARLCIVTAGRTEWQPASEVPTLTVAAFSVSELRRMLTAVAPLPDADWVDPFLAEVVAHGRGVPLVIVRTVRALERAAVLRADAQTGWSLDDEATWRSALAAIDASAWLRPDLGTLERGVLHLLALWPGLLEEERIARLAAGAWREASLETVRTTLADLAREGLVVESVGRWTITHALIADEVRAVHSVAEERAVLMRVLGWCEDEGVASWGQLRAVAQMCGLQDALPEAKRLVRAATGWLGRRSLGFRSTEVVKAVVAAAGHPAWQRELRTALRPTARLGRGTLGLLAGAAGLVIAAAAFAWWQAHPRLELELAPMTEYNDRMVHFRAQPRLRAVDGHGDFDPSASGTVRAELVGAPPGMHLLGDTMIAMVGGVAQFNDLRLESDSVTRKGHPYFIRFTGDEAWRVVEHEVLGEPLAGEVDALRLLRLRVDGREVAVDSVLRLDLGAPHELELLLKYTTTSAVANLPLGAAVTWGPRDSSTIRITSLPRPMRDARMTSRVLLPPPTAPGHHHIIIVFGYEDSADHVMSGTNWTIGRPVWNDGNDVHDLTEAELQELRTRGRVLLSRSLQRPWSGRDEFGVRAARASVPGAWVYGTAIEVEVVGR